MNRRDFLRVAAAGGVAAKELAAQNEPAANRVEQVLVMFKCHFDLGFIDTQAGVMRKYFQEFFPLAIRRAAEMRAAGENHYVWTTGSWLVYEYLEQAGPAERKQLEDAIARGDIAWHALPFSWQTELMDASMIAATIGFSKSLDRRFGRATTGAKMTDVPGHTRGLIAPLAQNGVAFLDVGVNSASTPPLVPSVFNWQDTDGLSIVMMYHHREYGGVVAIPGSRIAVSVNVRNDNSGPHTVDEINAIYAQLREQFPNARLKAANLTDIANAVLRYRETLPVLRQEIGDTWIYGVASDPVKVARFREVLRLRREWIAGGQLAAGDDQDLALMRRFSLAVEHTWGTDTKTWLDFDHYTPHDLAQMLDQPNYRTVMHSWQEKRDDIDEGVAALPAALRQTATKRLLELKANRPQMEGLQVQIAGKPIETTHFTVTLDPMTGAIQSLRNKASGRDWASTEHPLGLFVYQTFSKGAYDRFLDSYVKSKADWAPKDFGKPGIEKFGAQSRTWVPEGVQCGSARDEKACRIVTQLGISDAKAADNSIAGWPEKIYAELRFPDDEARVELNLSWFGKKANRLPEALWLTFQPNTNETRSWMLSKADRPVSPFDVVPGGNRHMHAIWDGLHFKDSQGTLAINSLDAPLVALGVRSPIYFSNEQPDVRKGIHFCLFNNGWGTNYIQWFGEDMHFRFTLSGT
ncbi:MAG: DUF5054 domain-containing protein [Acidobacteria bacterium]|nr:DUF5054 domain-containing protein [Acidobacteriota bacterium]